MRNSVRRRRKNIDSSSKSNPLRRRRKKNKVDELSTKILAIYLQQYNAHRNSGCIFLIKTEYETISVMFTTR